VDGNPEGARKTLFIRDDDYRLSFRHGNFATLSNLRERDVRRILEYRLSPLYVSVHATDPGIRRRLLRNPKAPAILEQLAAFAAGGIQFHTQIVVVPGVNDGAVLERSLEDLWALADDVLSVSVVPVALTAYSRHDLVRQPTAPEAAADVATVERWQARARAERGTGWVYGSDELYLLAGRPFPTAEAYDGFAQVENGVGAVRYLEQLVEREAERMPAMAGQRVLVCTGTAMGPLMPSLFPVLARVTGAVFELAVLENSYYGPSVTTAGLLPGDAFRRALAGRRDADLALLPAESVNEDGIFVDDLPLAGLEASVPMPVALSYHFTDALVPEAA
jgi:putative radical SAM enzyme (TIGR03279 family)